MAEAKLRIGWIGTGVMGAAMAGHVLAAGHHVAIHTRTRAKAAALLERGASWAETPREAAEGADVAISIVGDPADVQATHLGPAGTLSAARRPRFIIDMTTSRPSLARRIHAEAKARGVGSVDAPVSGGDVGARNATLSIMVGGDEPDVEAVTPLLGLMGAIVVRQGGAGAGQHTKMVNQILIAATMMGVCEGLLYASRAGLDALRVIESVGAGAAGSWAISNLGPRIVRGDFEPGFAVEHFIKDLGIALEEARAMGLDLPALALAARLYERLREAGHGRLGTQSLALLLESMSAASPALATDGGIQ